MNYRRQLLRSILESAEVAIAAALAAYEVLIIVALVAFVICEVI